MVDSHLANSRNVLVLGSDTRSFLSVVRSLARHDINVHTAWSTEGATALRSRYIHQIHEIVAPWEDEELWLEQLNQLMSSQQFELVIPCNDSALIPLQINREQLVSSDSFYLLTDEVFALTQSKILSTQLAESLGVNVPINKAIENLQEGLQFSHEVSYPVVLKPATSFRVDDLKKKQQVITVVDEQAMRSILPSMLSSGIVQAQQRFDGVGTGVEFIASSGRILSAFQHVRIHEPIKGGGSSYRASMKPHSEMLEAAKKIVAALNYDGVGMIEFRWNGEDDRWIFIEINGRFWGSLPLAMSSGADFPTYLYQVRVEQANRVTQEYRSGVYCRNWTRDYHWFSEQRATLGTIQFLATAAGEATAFFWRFLVFREHSDTLVWDDPTPGIVEFKELCWSISTGIFAKLRSATRQTQLYRRGYRKRLIRHLFTAKSILFVCKGNICRSPFAGEYAKPRVSPEVKISSAGYFPKSNRPAPENAQLASIELGVSLAEHRSHQLTKEDIASADLVIVFDEENFDRVRSDASEMKHKVFLLNHIRENGELFIKDPYSSSVSNFLSTYRDIQGSIDLLLIHLRSAIASQQTNHDVEQTTPAHQPIANEKKPSTEKTNQ